MSDRVQQGESDTFTVTFRDSVGAGITNAVGKIVLYDVPSAKYWSGAAFDSDPRFENNMDEIDETDAPGRWEFPFTYPNSDTLIDFEMINTALNADVNTFEGQTKVGGFVDNIDAPISDTATESNATSNTTAINANVDANEVKIDTIDSNVDAIKAKTDNLPVDPASEANVDANEAKLDIIDTTVDAIKASTDNLPGDPASEAAATANTAAINVNIDANETKIDAVKAKTDNLPADPTSEAVATPDMRASSPSTPISKLIASPVMSSSGKSLRVKVNFDSNDRVSARLPLLPSVKYCVIGFPPIL